MLHAEYVFRFWKRSFAALETFLSLVCEIISSYSYSLHNENSCCSLLLCVFLSDVQSSGRCGGLNRGRAPLRRMTTLRWASDEPVDTFSLQSTSIGSDYLTHSIGYRKQSTSFAEDGWWELCTFSHFLCVLLDIKYEPFAVSCWLEAVKSSLATHSVVKRDASKKRGFRRKNEGKSMEGKDGWMDEMEEEETERQTRNYVEESSLLGGGTV